MREVTVQTFFDYVRDPIGLQLHAGERGLGRVLKSARIQKPGLALAGYTSFVHPDRVQILGQTELSYLDTLAFDDRRLAVRRITDLGLACVVVTKDLAIPPELLEACEDTQTPLFRTGMRSSECIRKLLSFLDDLLAPRCRIHGVLVDVSGVGVLITGISAVGKSETALELVERGHRLVADDVVEVRRKGEDLVGQAAKIIQDLIEIRGLGILNVAELYGVAATRDHKRIELHVELEEWSPTAIYDRLGLEERTRDILGVPLKSLLVPVRPGRNIAGILEVAARNFLLRLRGHHAPLALNQRLEAQMPTESLADRLTDEAGSNLTTAAELEEATDHIQDEVE